jgi:hypothetical protein
MAKKKVNQYAQNKLLAAQRKKAYMQKLRLCLARIGHPEWFDLLPKSVLELIYGIRGGPFKIRVAQGEKITKRFVKMFYLFIDDGMKSLTMCLHPDTTDEREILLADYYQYLFPMETVLMVKDYSFKGKEIFDAFCEDADKRFGRYLSHTMSFISAVCCACNDLSKHYVYTFVYDKAVNADRLPKDRDSLKYQLLTLGTHPLDVRHVKIGGEKRLICQIGEFVLEEFVPVEVSLQKLRIPSAKADEKIPVYIQQHAVDRIMKRAYCSYPSVVLLLVSRAFSEDRKIIPWGSQYLIECFYDDLKIGYFAATYIDGLLVIRTFLLITHSGTPEGQKLEELTGLQRKDKAYLSIDDLRTLANSDIIDDGEIRDIFVKAGCESILKLCRQVRDGREYHALSLEGATQNRELSKMIHEYIHSDANDEDYFVNDE